MIFNFFKKPSSSFLGIDIGTTGTRVIQLGLSEGVIKLENYASIETNDHLEILGNGKNFNNIKMSNDKIAEDLKSIIQKAEIVSKNVAMSVPISSAFSSIITLPNILGEELAKAVQFEARQYVPIPLNEVIFDWSIVGKETSDKLNNLKQADKIKVLLVAIPRETTDKYIKIAKLLGLNLIALETESFSLVRSLVGKKEGVSVIVDIGNKTASLTVIDNGSIVGSHSVSGAGGEEITRIISHGFNIDFSRAEELKIDTSNVSESSRKKIYEIILPIISIIVSEIKKVDESYFRVNKKKVQKVILTGGMINLLGLVKYFTEELSVSVEIGNPWNNIAYDKILEKKIKKKRAYFFNISRS